MEWWNSLPIQLGSLGMLIASWAWWVRQIQTGKLIPKENYEALKQAQDDAITRLTEENRAWKEAYQRADDTKRMVLTQNGELLQVGRVVEAAIISAKELQ